MSVCSAGESLSPLSGVFSSTCLPCNLPHPQSGLVRLPFLCVPVVRERLHMPEAQRNDCTSWGGLAILLERTWWWQPLLPACVP